MQSVATDGIGFQVSGNSAYARSGSIRHLQQYELPYSYRFLAFTVVGDSLVMRKKTAHV